MFRKAKVMLMMVAILAVSTIVQAAPWTVTTTIAPAGKATVAVNGTPKTIFKKIVFSNITTPQATYTLTRDPAYKFTKYIVNGVKTIPADPLAAVEVTLNASTKPAQSLTATLAIQTFAITSTPPLVNGVVAAAFAPAKKTVKYGTRTVVTVSPKKGFAIASVSDNGSVVQAFIDKACRIPANDARGDLPSIAPLYVPLDNVKETHALTAVAVAKDAVIAVITPALDKTLPISYFTAGKKYILSASKSLPVSTVASPTTYAWSVDSADATITPDLKGGKTAAFTAQAAGNYTVTLTVTNGTSDSTKVVVHVTPTLAALNCADCHSSAVTSTPGSPAILSAYSASSHKTLGIATCATCHSTHEAGLIKDPINVCKNCHTAAGADIASSGHVTKANPPLSCPNCHNSHNNTDSSGTLSSACVACHTSATPALTFANHFGCANCHVKHTLVYQGDGLANCKSCHNGATATIVANFTKSSHNTVTFTTSLTCVSCHSPHNSADAYGAGTAKGCQTCHAVGSPYGIYSSNMVLKAPHGGGVAPPTAGAANVGDSVTQYLTQGAICSDCHGHDNTINAGFAEGGHGKVSSDPLNAWTHYNWGGTRTNNGTRQNGNCDRCHTAVGFIKLLGQDPAMQTRLALNTYTAAGKRTPNNILICVGCHKTAEGELRTDATPPGNPTPLTGGYFALFSSSTASITAGNTKIQIGFPGFKNSSICIPCHSGRSTDKVFVETIAKSQATSKNYSTISTSFYQHAANMAQTFIGTGGYDFTGKLATLGASTHNTVKMDVSDTQGPCVGCHYSATDKTHSLEVTGYSVCQSCHGGSFGSADVAAAKANFDAGVAVLDTLIRSKFNSLRTNPALPLETERANVRFGRFGKADGEPADAATATKAYGAWYNWQILSTYDKAAYTHNPNYAHQLLTDTGNYLMNPAGTFGGPSFNDYIATQKASGNPDAIIAESYISANNCVTCHTGAAFTVNSNNWAKSSHKTGNVYCFSCHNPMTTVPTYGAGTVNGCQACHTPGQSYGIYNADLTGKAPHFPTTANSWDVGALASYTNAGTTCDKCHGHNNAINAGWAEGGHGDVTAVPWRGDSGHTDWGMQGPAVSGVNFQSSPQQTNCIRCHTSNGFAAFVDSGFTMIDRNPTGGLNAPLTCNGCHTSPEGDLRLQNFTTATHGAKGYKALWGYSTAKISGQKVVTAIQLGDNKNSNICMPCHSQRASGQEIKDVFATGAYKQYSAGSGIYPHAAQPAAIFYGKGGYEFTATNGTGSSNGFAYQDRARHQRIGNYGTGTGYNNTGVTQGACVGCHMTSDKSHNLEVLSKDAVTGAYTQIVSTECALCHASEFTYQNVQAAKDDFNAAVKALGNVLVAKGLTLDGVNPLPERTAKDLSGGTKSNTAVDANNLTAQGKMGAWFNWYLFKTADPGAFAHNPSYARRLVMDSIDYLDDGVLNNSAAATIIAQNVSVLSAAENAAAINFSTDPGCLGCHFGSGVNSNLAPGIQTAPHFNTTGALVPGQTFTQAQLVVAGAQCNNCHGYGHGTDSPSYKASKAAYPNISAVQGKGILKNYAESAHGDINGLAWTDYNFLNLSSRATCSVCHTTRGFVAAVDSANANGGKVAATPFLGNAADTTKQVLACNACHSSTAWKTSVRTIPGGYVAGMGGFGLAQPAYITYADTGESNICTPCHASRENGASINASTADFTNTGFKNPHYLAASAVFYGKGGFQFYTSGVRYNTYGAAGKVGRNANWSHGKLGMDNYTTAALSAGTVIGTNKDNTGKVRGSGNAGQCVACHLGPTNTHTFGAFEVAKATWGTNSTNAMGCYGCHSSENMEEVAIGEKSLVDRSLDFLAYELQQYGLYFNNDKNPYFFSDAAFTPFVSPNGPNWTANPYGVVTTGKQTMGAAMNLKLLKAEKGSHVHNRAFMRALITDSLVYLQKGQAGIDADRRITATDPNTLINFTNYSTAISAPNADRIAAGQSGSTSSITAIKGYLIRNGARR